MPRENRNHTAASNVSTPPSQDAISRLAVISLILGVIGFGIPILGALATLVCSRRARTLIGDSFSYRLEDDARMARVAQVLGHLQWLVWLMLMLLAWIVLLNLHIP